jgi:hypothetical protein
MFRRNSLVWFASSLIALLACPAVSSATAGASTSAPTSIEEFRNQKVLVTEETLAPGETAFLPGNRPGILVFLTGVKAAVISGHGKTRSQSVKRGDTVFQSAQEASIKNAGSSTLSFVRIEFLTEGSQEVWGMTGLAPNYKILVENQFVRAYDIKIPAQSFEPQHTHHDRVVVCLSGAQLEHILPDGEKQSSTLETGDVVWRLGATHIGHNLGHNDLWVIAIEPK